MVKKNKTYFVSPDYQAIYVSPGGYKRIKPFIETAVVYRYYGYYCIHFSCFEIHYPLVETIRNFKSVDKQSMCDVCTFRLEKMVGTCRHQFQLLERVPTRDFRYLVDKLNAIGMVQDDQIMNEIYAQFDHDDGYYDGYHEFTRWDHVLFYLFFIPMLAVTATGYFLYRVIVRGVVRPLKFFWR